MMSIVRFPSLNVGLASMLSVLISSTFEIESNPFSDQSTPSLVRWRNQTSVAKE